MESSIHELTEMRNGGKFSEKGLKDLDIIIKSLEKTNRIIVVHEDNLTGGFGGEIVSLINEHAFELLDAPIKRVASKDIPVAYSAVLEDQILVQTDWIVDMINEIIEY